MAYTTFAAIDVGSYGDRYENFRAFKNRGNGRLTASGTGWNWGGGIHHRQNQHGEGGESLPAAHVLQNNYGGVPGG